MFKYVLTAIAAAVIGGGAVTIASDPFRQSTFPCAEDELLGYAPEFGPDRVGCIHVDVLGAD